MVMMVMMVMGVAVKGKGPRWIRVAVGLAANGLEYWL